MPVFLSWSAGDCLLIQNGTRSFFCRAYCQCDRPRRRRSPRWSRGPFFSRVLLSSSLFSHSNTVVKIRWLKTGWISPRQCAVQSFFSLLEMHLNSTVSTKTNLRIRFSDEPLFQRLLYSTRSAGWSNFVPEVEEVSVFSSPLSQVTQSPLQV